MNSRFSNLRILFFLPLFVLLILSLPTFSTAAPNDKSDLVPVIILMAERPDINALQDLVKGVHRQERSKMVWSELEDLADRTQHDLIDYLQSEERNGNAQSIRPILICNGISCELTPETILYVNERADVDRIIEDWPQPFEELPQSSPLTELDEIDDVSWNLEHIGATTSWDDGYKGQGILLAIIDTGANYLHTDLADHLWNGGFDYPHHGYDYFEVDTDPMDEAGHGSNCAGILAGDGTSGTRTGVAPDATLMILKVRGDLASGQVSDTWLAQDFVLEQGVDVVSMSLGWGNPPESDRPVWRENYTVLNTAGIVNVKSAGNRRASREPPDAISIPGDVPSPWRHPDEVEEGTRSGQITVGGTNAYNDYIPASSPGPVSWQDVPDYMDWPFDSLHVGLIKPDLAAPAVSGITIRHNDDSGYTSFGQTSMAAPQVAGAAALLLSKDDSLLPETIDSLLQTHALDLGDPGKDNDYGAGLIQIVPALDAIEVPFGYVRGNVIDVNTGEPAEGVTVLAVERPRRQGDTDANGDFLFAVQPGTYSFAVSVPPNPLFAIANITVTEDDTAEVNFEYPRGHFAIDPGEVRLTAYIGTEETQTLSMSNNGSLDVTVDFSVAPGAGDELSQWDEYWRYSTSALVGDSLLEGITAYNGIFYVCGANDSLDPKMIYVLDRFNDLITQYEQPEDTSLFGMRSLAFDGEFLYGALGYELVKMNPETGDEITRYNIPVPYSDILEYDFENEAFWMKNDSTNLLLIDHLTGDTLYDIETTHNINGLAIDPDATDAWDLYLATSTLSARRRLYKMNRETGESVQLKTNLASANNPYLSTLSVMLSPEDYSMQLFGILQTNGGDFIGHWKIRDYFDWATISDTEVIIPQGGEANITVTAHGIPWPIGDFDGILHVNYNADEGYTAIPMLISVTDDASAPEWKTGSAVPQQFTLHQPYPNPFNSEVTIRYSLPHKDAVEVKIFDILGREVYSTGKQVMTVGSHDLHFNGKDLASGMYFVRLKGSNGQKLTRKMVLLK